MTPNHSAPTPIPLRQIFAQALHPPIRDRSFWFVQLMVVIWAFIHIFYDLHGFDRGGTFPHGIPIDLLLIPVGYAALHYGLSGSGATTVWAILLWTPDLLLPHNKGHVASDIVQLTVVLIVALFVGLEIERAHLEKNRAEDAEVNRQRAERHYHQLFDTNASPIILVDSRGIVTEANPAASGLWGDLKNASIEELLGIASGDFVEGRWAKTVTLVPRAGEERIYRLSTSRLVEEASGTSYQIVLEDVTEEYRSESEARAWAVDVLRAQEEERRRIAREIHDDPLQRLLQLARRIETLSIDGSNSDQMSIVREELLEVVGHLRDVTRGLHPAGLDQYGLVAAVRGLLVDVEIEDDLAVQFAVNGDETRGSPESEVGIFRIIQEAVRNVIHHANATEMMVELNYDLHKVHLLVRDNGRGFSRRDLELRERGHLGILGMYERANLLDGHCTVSSTPDEGTVVEATIPLVHLLGGSATLVNVMTKR